MPTNTCAYGELHPKVDDPEDDSNESTSSSQQDDWKSRYGRWALVYIFVILLTVGLWESIVLGTEMAIGPSNPKANKIKLTVFISLIVISFIALFIEYKVGWARM